MSALPVPGSRASIAERLRGGWDRLAVRERRLVATGTVLAALALGAVGIPALLEASDQAQARAAVRARQLAAARAALDAAQGLPVRSPVSPAPPAARVQSALQSAGLPSVTVSARGAEVALRAEAVGFDAFLGLLERIEQQERLHVTRARFFALPAAGQVRVEVELAP